MSDKSFFKKRLESSFCADCSVDWNTFRASLRHQEFPDREREFKKELAEAILNKTITTQEFERLTDIDFDTQEEIVEFLISEIWKPLYGNEPVS